MPCRVDVPELDYNAKKSRVAQLILFPLIIQIYEYERKSQHKGMFETTSGPSYIISLHMKGEAEKSLRRLKKESWYLEDVTHQKLAPKLCHITKNLSESQRDFYLYNGRNRVCRNYGNWWEDHQRDDIDRIEQKAKDYADRQARNLAQQESERVYKKTYGFAYDAMYKEVKKKLEEENENA